MLCGTVTMTFPYFPIPLFLILRVLRGEEVAEKHSTPEDTECRNREIEIMSMKKNYVSTGE